MSQSKSPTIRLLAGFVITLSAVGLYSGYTVMQLRGLERLQGEIIDRNRTDSLLLLRIQNDLNSLGLAIRDMLDQSEPYGLVAWQAQLRRVRGDLEDAVAREAALSPGDEQRRYLSESIRQFWDSVDRIFGLARAGSENEARAQLRLSLEARQQSLATAVSRLLIQNNEAEQQAAARVRGVYAGVQRNLYLFVAAMLVLIVATSSYLVHDNRRVFLEVAELSARRRDLARQLISLQESTFASISRDLHDEFGQILTAIGAMIPRHPDLMELREIVQETLDKVRTLSQALHPVVLDEMGLEGAIDQYLPGFERRTGLVIQYEKQGESREIEREMAIQIYRIMQEALTNVVKHSKSKGATVRLRYLADSVVLEVEDYGIGLAGNRKPGMGMISMPERASLVNGRLDLENVASGGVRVRLTVPVNSHV